MSYPDNNDIIGILKDPTARTRNSAVGSTHSAKTPSNGDDHEDIQVITRDDYPFDMSLDTHQPDGASGLTPILSSLDDPIDEINNYNRQHDQEFPFENQLVQQPKLYSNLPPLQPLSDSVIPNGLGFQPLSLEAGADSASRNDGVPAVAAAGPTSAANKRKREISTPKTRPAFVMKIWSMVNDPANHDYIRWDDDGESFQVFHREKFMKDILPKYFKHNNFASFVRQLNMYGWHKVQDISSGTLKDDKNGDENWKFSNPNFISGREDLLDNIVRNKSMANELEMAEKNPTMKLILNEMDNIKLNQLALSEDLRRIRKDNKTLWSETYMARERHAKQSQTLDKILKFLATIYGNNNTGRILEVNYDEPNPVNGLDLDTLNEDFNLDDLTDKQSQPQKPRLMLMNQAYRSNRTTPSDVHASNTPYIPDDVNIDPPAVGDDVINGLEHNLYKNGQSIQQVQDWVQKLSNSQQLLSQQLNAQRQAQQQSASRANTSSSFSSGSPLTQMSPRIDLDFDVNDFLHSNSSANTPVNQDEPEPKRKRFKTSNIEEIDD